MFIEGSDHARFQDHLPGPDGPLSVYVRPHELRIDRYNTGESSLEAKVVHVTPAECESAPLEPLTVSG